MDIKEARKYADLPEKVYQRLIKDGIIGEDITDDDIRGLSFLAHVWGNRVYLKMQLAALRKKERAELVLFPNFSKIELYILRTYLNLPEGKSIEVNDIKQRLKKYMGVRVSTATIRRVRGKAYNLRLAKQRGRRDKIAAVLDLWLS